MTSNGRIAAFAIAGLAVTSGVWMQFASADGSGFPLFMFAALVVVGTMFDAGYLARRRKTSGPWQRTTEREVDHQSGQILEVWYDPHSGERRYLPVGQSPD